MFKDDEAFARTIKVKDYLPLYGFYCADRYAIGIKGKTISVNELFEEFPEYELDPVQVNMLDSFDRGSLQFNLNQILTGDHIIEYLRDLLDEYKMEGGSPLVWIGATIFDLELNFDNYPAKYRGLMQTNLIAWAEYYEKLATRIWEPEIESEIATAPETTAAKYSRILEPVRMAFDTPLHLEVISKALAEYAEKGIVPEKYNCMNILMPNKEFYKPFKILQQETNLTLPGISKVLHRFIYANNGSRNAIQESAIYQNLKRKY